MQEVAYDYCYDDTLRIKFPIDIEDDSVSYNTVNDLIYQFFGRDIEIDWRDSREVEIHNIKDNRKDIGFEKGLTSCLNKIFSTSLETMLDNLQSFEMKIATIIKDASKMTDTMAVYKFLEKSIPHIDWDRVIFKTTNPEVSV